MGTEYRITFEPDERYSSEATPHANLWPTYRPRLETWLRAMPGTQVRGSTLEFRAPTDQAHDMPGLAIEVCDADIYACDYGDAALTASTLGAIMLALVREGFRVKLALLE